MSYTAIDPTAASFKRAVVGTGAGRSRRGVKTVTGSSDSDKTGPIVTNEFTNPFKEIIAPEIPQWVGFRGGTGDSAGGAVGPNPTYQAPTLSIVANPITGEVGSPINVQVTPAWAQRDAGAPVPPGYQVTLTGVTTFTNPTPITNTFNGVQLGDSARQLRASVAHAAGPIKNDNQGNPFPTGSIQAGTVQSNIINITGFRKAFWAFSSVPISTPTTSTGIRAFEVSGFSMNNIATAKQIVMSVPIGTRDIIFAFPVAVGNIRAVDGVVQTPGNFDIQGAFTQSIVNVDGATAGQDTIQYYVYHVSNDIATSSVTTLTVNIQ